ncbi:uncharacterized protein LOC108043809 [Drosophila rhopaloa]|uniref:Uncharacterized protein LOC108043809 n=1 Tax=Drosophila rhopaloa TaxID=1041015 RepID=A0A6P4ENC6_DRORH|nr:uncharacterized protein LOC108043809 [Drosophila rhopaloa]
MRTWFWIRWLLIFKCVSTAQRNFRIFYDDVNVKIFDMDRVEKFGCQVLQMNNRSYTNCQVRLRHNIIKLTVRTALDFFKQNGQSMKLYDVRLDACRFMDTVHKNRMFNIYAKSLKKLSNLKCPLKANFNYTLEKLYLDEQDFPSFVPFGTFRSFSEFYVNQSIVGARIKVHGKVTAWH